MKRAQSRPGSHTSSPRRFTVDINLKNSRFGGLGAPDSPISGAYRRQAPMSQFYNRAHTWRLRVTVLNSTVVGSGHARRARRHHRIIIRYPIDRLLRAQQT